MIQPRQALATLVQHNSDLGLRRIASTNLLNSKGFVGLFERYQHRAKSVAEQMQMDAIINHLLSVQILHEHFIATDVPKLGQKRSEALGWSAALAMV